MRKVNELYGKSIVHQATGNRIATVRDAVLDAQVSRVIALLADEGQLMGASRVVRWNAVVSVGDVIVINSALPLPAVSEDQEVTNLLAQTNRITGTTIVSDGGKHIGTVGDLFIDEQGAIVGYEVKQGLFTDLRGRKFLPVGDVQAVGKDAVIAVESELATVKAVERQKDTAETGAEHPTDDGTL